MGRVPTPDAIRWSSPSLMLTHTLCRTVQGQVYLEFYQASGRELGMRHRKLIILAGVVVALLLAGCASPPERALSEKAPSYAALPNGYDPLNPDQLSPLYAALKAQSGENFIRYLV